jgi:hypothetical protein
MRCKYGSKDKYYCRLGPPPASQRIAVGKDHFQWPRATFANEVDFIFTGSEGQGLNHGGI